jgi:hypothetical protein
MSTNLRLLASLVALAAGVVGAAIVMDLLRGIFA